MLLCNVKILPMEFIDTVNAYVSKYVTLTNGELAVLGGMFELRNFKKRQLLVAEGEAEHYLNFILNGVAIKFFFRKKEKMVTQFARENELICSYGSFLSGNPSNYAVEALEETSVLSVTKMNVDRLYEFSPKMERLGRLITTDQFLRWELFDYDRLRLSSSDRFVNFIRNNPDLLQRVPQKYLASYLNMKPETFSRLKHLMKRPS
jgi:CRP-like cAMP-binding protein